MAKNDLAQAKTNLPSTEVDAFDQYAGAGLENVTKSDVLIPRLTLLQALSPQLNKKKPEYIEGAGIGDIADVGTGEIFEGDIQFLPVHFAKVWIEWAPRDSGKGLVAIHNTAACLDDCTQNDRGQLVNAAGNYFAETSQFFGFNLKADRRKCFVSFTSTQLKKARKWNTLALSEKVTREDGSEYTPPLFFRTYSLGSAEESNAQGDWAGWTINRGPKLQELPNWKNLFSEAVQFRDQIVSGEVKGDNSDLGEDAASAGASEGAM